MRHEVTCGSFSHYKGRNCPCHRVNRDVFKVAISESRILGVRDGQVRFAYAQPASSRRRTMVLAASEFIRRFLQHVLPPGFMKVRRYGFISRFGVPFEEVRARVEMAHGFAARPVA